MSACNLLVAISTPCLIARLSTGDDVIQVHDVTQAEELEEMHAEVAICREGCLARNNPKRAN
jgi:hypothetical protein